jgi:dienelactone hydrolase
METFAYEDEGEAFDLAVARPSGEGPHPVVLVFHAWEGRDAFAEDKARKLAELGYIGAAVDLYGVGKRGTDRESSQKLMLPLVATPAVLRRRIAKVHEVVSALEGVDRGRMGAIGFCFGGTCALLAARMGLPLRGVVSFHGLLKLGERLNERVHARILLQHGQDDPMVPPEDVAGFAEEMKRVRAEWTLHAYPGVMHSFTNPKAKSPELGTVFDADADRASWIGMRQFFADLFA